MADDTTQEVETISQETNPLLDKVLKEKKNAMTRNMQLQEELQSMKVRMQEIEEEKLQKERNFEQLAEQRKSEIESWRQKYENQQKFMVDTAKVGSIKSELSKLGINQDRVDLALKMVDINKLQYDNEAKIILGADDLARELASKVPEWFGSYKRGVNQDAPKDSFGSITLEKWRGLPEGDKYKPEVLKELYKSQGIDRK